MSYSEFIEDDIDSGICVDCNKVETSKKDDDGQWICVECSNDRFFELIKQGVIHELRIDLRRVKKSTFEKIKHMIELDKIEFEEKKGK